MSPRFSTDTAVTETGPGCYRGRIDRGWWIERGPNGGYVGALVLRAMTTEVADPGRSPRSLTIHYLRPPAEGDVEVEVTVERSGRTLTSVSARMSQGGRLLVVALGAFAAPRPGPVFADATMPEVPAPEDCPRLPPPSFELPIRDRYESRLAIGGPPFEGRTDAPAVAGGWLRLAEPEPVDAHVLTAFTDAWVPPIFSKLVDRIGVPTVDLTVHFRTSRVLTADSYCLASFATGVADEGFLTEDGTLWASDGTLLAESRQLAVILGD